MWGLLAAPLLNKNDGILYVGDKHSFKVLGWNILGGVAIIVWTALFSTVLFLTLKFFKKLKVAPDVEGKGKLKVKMKVFSWLKPTHFLKNAICLMTLAG